MPVKIHGLKALERELTQLPEKVAKKHLDGAVRKAAILVRNTARTFAPGDEGRLHRNILYFKRRRQAGSYTSRFGVSVRTKGDADSYDNAYYYKFVELGTRFQAAQPFLRPALEINKLRAVGAMSRELWARIKKEAADSYSNSSRAARLKG